MLHPDIMADLLDEVLAAPPLNDADHATLSSLRLLDAVVKEVLRLIPPNPKFCFGYLHHATSLATTFTRQIELSFFLI